MTMAAWTMPTISLNFDIQPIFDVAGTIFSSMWVLPAIGVGIVVGFSLLRNGKSLVD